MAHLVERARVGDQKAWSALVTRFAPLVFSVANRYCGDRILAADVSQVTWLRLAEHLDRLREPERIAGWLTVTAKHEAYRATNRRNREIPSDLDRTGVAIADDPADHSVADERDRLLARVVSQLSQQCQVLLRLLFDGLSYAEISAITGLPHGSIGPTRARCLATARQIIGDSYA